MKTVNKAREIILSGVSAIHVTGSDYAQIDEFAKSLAGALGFELADEWNYGYGLVDFGTKMPQGCEDFGKALAQTMYDSVQAGKKLFLIKNARLMLEGDANRQNLARLQQTILHIKKFNPRSAVIVYADEQRFIPIELESLVYFIPLSPPDKKELAALLDDHIKNNQLTVQDSIRNALPGLCVGMSKDSFLQVLRRASQDSNSFNNNVFGLVQEEKKQFVDKSGLLSFIPVKEKLADIGGLEYLKFWLSKKQDVIRDPEKALENGITPPKGILLVGMPGCGKSLSAKATADLLGFPLLRLDIGSLMGKYVGESENNMRRALTVAEQSSPCVLWVDELEKAFAGISGDGTGITARLFGFFLTWLQEKEAPVFVVATANDISMLKPELLRRGRFDEIFYLSFPSLSERELIFNVHLKKKKIPKESFIDTHELAFKSDGYAGSDIESLVNNAAEYAVRENLKLSREIIQRNMAYMTPLKKILGKQLDDYKKKFDEYQIKSASTRPDGQSECSKEHREMLDDMINSSDPARLEMAAIDEFITDEDFKKIASCDYEAIRISVLDNPNCPLDIIKNLCNDKNERVRENALRLMQYRGEDLSVTSGEDPSREKKLEKQTCENCGQMMVMGKSFYCPIAGDNPSSLCGSWQKA